MSNFEDTRQLFKCSRSDCDADRAGGTPLCARHLREQETSAAGIVEPEVEARARAAGEAAMRDYHGPDPDTVMPPMKLVEPNMTEEEKRAVIRSGQDGILRAHNLPQPPNMGAMEPRWDGSQWVLRPKEKGVDLKAVESLVRELMSEFGIIEWERDDRD